ncbi:MAG: hypothetical protein HKL85_02800 [Acidimicrobiaceae bacterium]|jgi:hypothetical protein|nr:hypothetical protein [Acidimicrobiaceae bacterium]
MTSFEPRRFLGVSPDAFPPFLRPWFKRFHVDFSPQLPPTTMSVVAATVVAIVASLAADAVLVKIGVSLFPSTKGYVHFRFSDYSKLTIIGVIIACVGWPIVARISSQPKWLFLRAAVVVTAFLFVPDAMIWFLGQSAAAVFVLVWMHLAIAVVTYLALIILAPVRGRHMRR